MVQLCKQKFIELVSLWYTNYVWIKLFKKFMMNEAATHNWKKRIAIYVSYGVYPIPSKVGKAWIFEFKKNNE